MAQYWRRYAAGACRGALQRRNCHCNGDPERVTCHCVHCLHEATWAIDTRGGGEGRQLEGIATKLAVMRGLAMRFRGILRGDDPSRLDSWLNDARATGLYGIRRFAQVLHRDIDAVRNAISERWSNGQTEGQINRLKTLKRAMYGRAGTELLRARLLPLRL